jgi:glycosyltransferase involved in cell wall biosynthesis
LEFFGYVTDDELAALYETADAVCVPSRYESQGLVGNEALQFGRPLIASNTGAMGSMVDGNGWLVTPGCTNSLGRALRAFASCTSLEPLGKRSIELAERFSPDQIGAQLIERFQDLLIRQRTRAAAGLDDYPSSRDMFR